MKRTIFTILLLSLFLLVGCQADSARGSEGEELSEEPPVSEIPQETEAQETMPSDYDPANYIGFYDPHYDYESEPRYKVQYIVMGSRNTFNEKFDEAFEHWTSKMNIDYGAIWYCEEDAETYINNITVFAEQGVDGFLINAHAQMYPRIDELLEELGIPWMTFGSEPRDYEQEGAPLLHPNVSFDYYERGVQMAETLLELKDELWPDAPYEEIGFIFGEMVNNSPFNRFNQGAYDTWIELTGLENNYFKYNYIEILIEFDSFYSEVRWALKNNIEENPEIKYWLYAADMKEVASCAVSAFEELGVSNNACVASSNKGFDDEYLAAQLNEWDEGKENIWYAMDYIPYTIYAEPIIGALYAFMSGQATPETIWPEWVNRSDCGGEDNSYASLIVPSYWIDCDNYQSILKWTDIYAGTDNFPHYPADGITPETYSARAKVPKY